MPRIVGVARRMLAVAVCTNAQTATGWSTPVPGVSQLEIISPALAGLMISPALYAEEFSQVVSLGRVDDLVPRLLPVFEDDVLDCFVEFVIGCFKVGIPHIESRRARVHLIMSWVISRRKRW